MTAICTDTRRTIRRSPRVKAATKARAAATLLAGRWLGTHGHPRRSICRIRPGYAISMVLVAILSLSTLPAGPVLAQPAPDPTPMGGAGGKGGGTNGGAGGIGGNGIDLNGGPGGPGSNGAVAVAVPPAATAVTVAVGVALGVRPPNLTA
jgi:hypothetical protein